MSHRIHDHGLLTELAPGLWQVVGTHPLPIHRNMIVYRMPSGGLLLHSVVAMDEPGMAALEVLGAPEIMIVPHSRHGIDAPFYQARYPDIKIACPAQSRKRLQERTGLRIDGTVPEVLEGSGVAAHMVDGARFHEYALRVSVPGGTALVFNDVVANDGRETETLAGRLMGLTGVPGGGFGISRTMRLFTDDRCALAACLRRLATDDLRLVAMSHGTVVRDDPAAALRGAAETL